MSDVSAPLPELQWLSDDWRKPVKQACDLIAPVWPLDQWIAVNPFWGLRHFPAPRVDQVLNERAGFSMLMPTEFYREAFSARAACFGAMCEVRASKSCRSGFAFWTKTS